MSTVDSQAVFCDRALSCGLSEALIARLKEDGLASFAKLAFCCSYTPGGGDDQALIAVLTQLNGGNQASAGVASSFRRLFFEAFTLAASELRSRLDRSEDSGPKKMPVPERVHRYNELQKRLGSAIRMESELEPSDALVDLCCSQHEENRLQWIPWEKLTKRDAEMTAGKKKEGIVPDSQGKLKWQKEDVLGPADLSSDLFIRYALQRRSLAYDMSTLFKYEDLELWNDAMFERRMREPVPGFATVTVQQLMAADKFLFERMGRLTRAGCVPSAAGVRPLDQALKECMSSAEVQMYLMPSQVTSSSSTFRESRAGQDPEKKRKQADGRDLPNPNSKRQKKLAASAAKGKGKGKGKGMGAGGVPSDLAGGVPKDDQGRSICFNYNRGLCKQSDCKRGRHCCMKKGCFSEEHVYVECPN